MYIPIKIEFRPRYVKYECPYCGYEEELDYDKTIFSEELWEDISEVHCFNCHKDFEFSDIETYM